MKRDKFPTQSYFLHGSCSYISEAGVLPGCDTILQVYSFSAFLNCSMFKPFKDYFLHLILCNLFFFWFLDGLIIISCCPFCGCILLNETKWNLKKDKTNKINTQPAMCDLSYQYWDDDVQKKQPIHHYHFTSTVLFTLKSSWVTL